MCPALVKEKYIIRFAICAKSSTLDDIEYSWKEIRRLGDLVLDESQITSTSSTPSHQSKAFKQEQQQQTSIMSSSTTTTTNGLVAAANNQLQTAQINVKLNGKIQMPQPKTNLNRSISDISVVSLPRLNDLKTAYANLLEAAGEDIQREGLLKTPERAAKAFQFFTAGYHQDLKGECLLIVAIDPS